MNMVPIIAAMAAANATKADSTSVPSIFKEAGATSPGEAIAWAPEGDAHKLHFKQLVAKGALVEMRAGHWYLNEEKLAAPGAVPAGLVVAALALVALLAGVFLLLG